MRLNPHIASWRHCGGRQKKKEKMAAMGLDMLADMDVDKVANMVANIVAHKKKVDLELDMEA